MIFSKVRNSLICFLFFALFSLTSYFLPLTSCFTSANSLQLTANLLLVPTAYAEVVSASASSLLERGIRLLNENKPDEALNAFEEAAALNPKDPLPLYYSGVAYQLKKDPVAALTALNKALSLEPGMPLALLRVGIILEEAGRLDKAADAYQALAQREEDTPQVKEARDRLKKVTTAMHYRMATKYFKEKNYAGSLKELQIVIEINPDDIEANFAMGLSLQRLGRFKESIEAFKNVTRIDPQNVNAYFQVGVTSESQSDYDGAIDAFNKVISILTVSSPDGTAQSRESEKRLRDIEKKKETRKHFENSARLIKEEKWDEALTETRAILDIEASNPNALFNLGLILYKLKQDEPAIEALKKSIDIDPRFQKGFYQLGVIYDDETKFEDAIDAYKNAADIDAKSDEGKKSKDRIENLKVFVEAEQSVESIKEFMKKGDIEGAIKEVEGILKIRGEDPKLYITLATLYLKVVRVKDAVFALEKAAALSPKDIEVRMLLGKAYEGLNEYQKAADVYDSIASIEKETPRGKDAAEKAKKNSVLFHLKEGKRYLGDARYEESLQEMKEVLKITPEDPLVLFNIGVLYYRLNVPEEAEPPLKQALTIQPRNVNAHLQLGLVFEKMRRFDDARDEFNKVIEIQKAGKEASIAGARIKYLKEYKELTEHLDSALKYMKEKEWDKAMKEIDVVLKANPQNYIGYYYKGIILFQAGIEDEAKAELKKAIEIKPNYFPSYLRLGDIYFKEYEFEDARRYYQQVITLGKDTPEAEIAADSLKRLKAWWLTFSMKHGYNSNITFRTNAVSSAQSSYALGVTYFLVRKKDWYLSSDLTYHDSIYYQTQFKGSSYTLQLNGTRQFSGDRSVSSSGTYSKSFFDGKATYIQKSFSATARTEPRTIPTSAALSYNGSIGNSLTNKLSNSEQHSFSLSLSQKLSVRDTLSGSYGFSIYKNLYLNGSNYANRTNSMSLGYSRALTSLIGFNLGYSISFVNYSNPDSTTLFQQYRTNVNETINSGLSLNISEDVNLSFSYGFSYYRSRTNLPQLTAEEFQKLQEILASPIPTVGGGGGSMQHNIGITLSTTF